MTYASRARDGSGSRICPVPGRYPSAVRVSDETGPYRIYRSIIRVLVRGGACILAGMFLILSFGAAGVFAMPQGDTASRLGAVAVMMGIGALLIWLGVRMIGSRIAAGPDGIVIHRAFRRRQFVPWEQAADIELIPTSRLNNQFTRTSVAVAVLRNGHRPAYCLGASFDEPSQAAETMLYDLRAEHEAWQTTRSADNSKPDGSLDAGSLRPGGNGG
jgi:hypothetical protein